CQEFAVADEVRAKGGEQLEALLVGDRAKVLAVSVRWVRFAALAADEACGHERHRERERVAPRARLLDGPLGRLDAGAELAHERGGPAEESPHRGPEVLAVEGRLDRAARRIVDPQHLEQMVPRGGETAAVERGDRERAVTGHERVPAIRK